MLTAFTQHRVTPSHLEISSVASLLARACAVKPDTSRSLFRDRKEAGCLGSKGIITWGYKSFHGFIGCTMSQCLLMGFTIKIDTLLECWSRNSNQSDFSFKWLDLVHYTHHIWENNKSFPAVHHTASIIDKEHMRNCGFVVVHLYFGYTRRQLWRWNCRASTGPYNLMSRGNVTCNYNLATFLIHSLWYPG